MQDVDAFVRAKGIELAGYLDPSRPARIDDEHQIRLNYEAFFFADTVGRNRFRTEPLRYCGLLTDPVTKRRFLPGPDSPSLVHEDVRFYFESRRSAARFELEPERYALPGWTM